MKTYFRKYRYLSLLLVLFLTISAEGQEQISEKEQIIFREKVKEVAAKTNTIVSDFVQEKHLSVFKGGVKSAGKMVFLMPDKIRWEYTAPTPNIAIFYGNKLFVSDNGNKKSFDLDSNKIFKSFNDLIVKSIKGDMFDEGQFEISYFQLSEDYMVRFVPKEKRLRKVVAAFELKFENDTPLVKEVRIIESKEDYTVIQFTNRKTNVAVSESVFDH